MLRAGSIRARRHGLWASTAASVECEFNCEISGCDRRRARGITDGGGSICERWSEGVTPKRALSLRFDRTTDLEFTTRVESREITFAEPCHVWVDTRAIKETVH
jgi:hypothetical protein